MKTFRFDATVLTPPVLPPDVRDSFQRAMEGAGATDLRINEVPKGRTTVSFVLEAPTEREALATGSESTLSALESASHVRWVSSGVTSWQDG